MNSWKIEKLGRWRASDMIQKVVKKRNLNDSSSIREDLAYWLSRPAEERVATIDFLRRQYHGSSAIIQRTARVIKRTQG